LFVAGSVPAVVILKMESVASASLNAFTVASGISHGRMASRRALMAAGGRSCLAASSHSSHQSSKRPV
jgi:hypothetical protein